MYKYDVVIPVSYKDCWFLRKNIPYIRKNLVAAQTIYVITSSRCFGELSDEFCETHNVKLLDENTLWSGLSFSAVKDVLLAYKRADMTGWYFQQFLKLAFALTVYAKEYYLVWDADTIPLNKISFFNNDVLLINPKKEYHEAYFRTINNLFGIEKKVNYSFIAEHMILRVDVIKEILSRLGDSWWQTILHKADVGSERQCFSEFETIGTYSSHYYPSLYKTRYLSTLRCGGMLFGRHVTSRELYLLAMDFDTASFERAQYPVSLFRTFLARMHKAFIELKYRIFV